uniref:FAM192A/Fyv6 N-terminal domain-containing protein n=1 Tax=Peronospora matthiolae TaxID=2874970 RepID=A0AAV1USJ2_9STRA
MNTNAGPRASLAGFVSTSVLTSSDGLFGDNVQEERVTETPAPRADDRGSYKPLYEQLQECQEKKDSEWKAKNNPFAPPKGLDDDEFEYIKELESKKNDVEQQRQAQHKEDLADFLVARRVPKAPADASLTLQHLQKFFAESGSMTASKKQRAVVVVKSKRRRVDKIREADVVASEGSDKPKQQRLKKQKVENLCTSVVAEKKKPRTAVHGLVSYGSDSDSDGGNTAS